MTARTPQEAAAAQERKHMNDSELLELARKKRPDNARDGNCCCTWLTFAEGFSGAFTKWFDEPPTKAHWAAAVRDWKAGNTGWEAAHNAQRRAKEREGEACVVDMDVRDAAIRRSEGDAK
jgi:hypothetical protein